MTRVWRRQTVRFGIAFVWLVPAAFFAALAFEYLAFGAVAAVFAVLAVRTLRIGVVTGPDGVVVRGILGSWTLRWDEIARFEWGLWRGPGIYPCGVVRRSDGSTVTVLALNPPYERVAGTDRTVPDLLAALNEELGRARGIPAPFSGAPDPYAVLPQGSELRATGKSKYLSG